MKFAHHSRSARELARGPWLSAMAAGAAFLLLAELSAPFVFRPYQNAVVWLPGGLSLGVLVRSRRERWPYLLLAFFLAEVLSVRLHGDPLIVGALWGVANCARAAVGAALMQRFVGAPVRFDRLRDVAGLIAFGGGVGPAISATIGTLSLAVFYPPSILWRDWLFWFLSDAMGTVLVAPLILTARIDRKMVTPVRLLEWGLLAVVLLFVGDAIFREESNGLRAVLPFIGFPLLIYAALRTGPAGAAFASVVMGALAVWHTTEGRGPFGNPLIQPYSRVLAVECVIALMSLSALTLAAAIRERQRHEQKERLLAEVGGALVESLDVTRTLPCVARRIASTVARGAAIWLRDPEDGLRRVASALVPDPSLRRLEEQVAYVSRGVSSWVDPISHVVLVPLSGHGELLGVLAVLPREAGRPPSTSERELFEALGRSCALAVENARLYDESQRAIRVRDEFIAIAAHELRTPLTSMKLQLDARLRRQDDPHVASFFQSVQRQMARLTRLVENVLDISRLSRGHLELSPELTDLSDVVRDLAAQFSGDAVRVGSPLELRIEDGVRGMWDRPRIEQAISNLLGNALKFGDGHPIEVSVAQHGDEASVTVRDHGRGIPPQEQRRIFDRFAQAVPAREFGGLGLGLFLTREIAEAHGGRISVSSRPGEGACFELTLAALPRTELRLPAPSTSPPPG